MTSFYIHCHSLHATLQCIVNWYLPPSYTADNPIDPVRFLWIFRTLLMNFLWNWSCF